MLRPGSVPDAELGSYYRDADVFVCLSEHEGFCNTVIEAMALDLPVVARGTSALPTTVADGGLVLSAKASSETVAAAVHRVVTDEAIASAFVTAGRDRHHELTMASSGERFCDLLSDLAHM